MAAEYRLPLTLFLVFVTTVVSNTTAQFNRLDSTGRVAVEQAVETHMQRWRIVGCSVGLLKDGEVAYLRGFGYRDRENRLPTSEITLYRTGSVAKSFAATAALQLYEDSLLNILADVRSYVPEYPEKPQGTITPYRLLAHRSGIRHYDEFDTLLLLNYEKDRRDYDPIAALDIFKNGSILFQPGSAFSYTTFGYNLLGAAVERAGGQPFEDQVRERINRKLDLPYLQPEYQWKRPYPEETSGYHDSSGTMVETIDNVGILYKVPGGGFICSVIDMTLYMQGLFENRLFDDNDLLEWAALDHSGGRGFGLGIINQQHNGKHYLWHAGGQQKANCIYLYHPGTGDGVALMANTFGVHVLDIALEVIEILPNVTVRGDRYKHIEHVLSAPAPIRPPNGVVIDDTKTGFEWTSVRHAFTYVYQLDTDSLFRNAVPDTTRSSGISVDGLFAGSRYYWRVKALNTFLYDTTVSDWSRVSFFDVREVTSIARSVVPSNFFPSIYPNPAKDIVVIRSGKNRTIQSVIVCTLLGESVLSLENLNRPTVQLDMKDRKGLFLLTVITGDGIRTTKKLLVR